MHAAFVAAVDALGGASVATPALIQREMGVPWLQLVHLKSHLQKHRLAVGRGWGGGAAPRARSATRGTPSEGGGAIGSSADGDRVPGAAPPAPPPSTAAGVAGELRSALAEQTTLQARLTALQREQSALQAALAAQAARAARLVAALGAPATAGAPPPPAPRPPLPRSPATASATVLAAPPPLKVGVAAAAAGGERAA